MRAGKVVSVAGRVAVRGVNVNGNRQSDPRVHGGPDQAVYAYASEDIGWWSAELRRPLAPGIFGENLTLAGIDVTGARVGERWKVGTAVLEVRGPRMPCGAGRPGAYLRIVEEGDVAAGDEVTVLSCPDDAETMGDYMRRLAKKG